MGEEEELDGPPPPVDLIFKDEGFYGKTLSGLDMMRKSKQFCDVILQVGKTAIHAHRAVLACASPYLLELFTVDDENKGKIHEDVITYRLNGGIEREAFERLVDYSYTARLQVPPHLVKAVYLAASRLKMETAARACSSYLIEHLDCTNCVEVRSLPGIGRRQDFVGQIDAFIQREFDMVAQLKQIQALPRLQVEVLHGSKEERALVNPAALCQLVMEWVFRQCDGQEISMDQLTGKGHLLYVALDNSLQDCNDIPNGELNDSEIVQDYKKMSKRLSHSANNKPRKRAPTQPAKPRLLLYARMIGDQPDGEMDHDWKLIATTRVAEHSSLGLVTVGGQLATLSVVQRINSTQIPPNTPNTQNQQYYGSSSVGAHHPYPPSTTPSSASSSSSRAGSQERDKVYKPLPTMSSAKCAVGCAAFGDNLVVCGGYDRTECLRVSESYNPRSNRWSQLPLMREARGRFSIALVDGRIFAVGGSNGTTELATVEHFDTGIGKWKAAAKLPLPRSNAGVCSLDGKLYCIGGWNGQYGIRQCEIYDAKADEWASIAPLNVGRYQSGVSAMDGRVYAVGGCDSWNCMTSVECYDPVADKWSFLAEMGTARRGCGAALFNGKLVVVGGSDGSHSLCSMEVYDPSSKRWSPGPNMTACRANVGVAVVGNRLYAVGGFSGKNFLNSIEYLESLDGAEWTTFVRQDDGSISTEEEDEEIGSMAMGNGIHGTNINGNNMALSSSSCQSEGSVVSTSPSRSPSPERSSPDPTVINGDLNGISISQLAQFNLGKS